MSGHSRKEQDGIPVTAASKHRSECIETALPRAELYLCLARLFEARTRPLPLPQWHDLLSDLQALAAELPVPGPKWLEDFGQCLASLQDAEQVLVEYTRLFLMPPAPAPLNLGYYRDGGHTGQTGTQLAVMYRRHGLERTADFHDLDDHLVLNLQWQAWCWASVAEDNKRMGSVGPDLLNVIEQYSLPACRQLAAAAQKLEQEGRVSALWPQLIRLVTDLLAADQALLAAQRPERTEVLPVFEAAPTLAEKESQPLLILDCRSCGNRFEAEDALSTMIRQLHKAGLDTAHLETCAECRHPDRQPATLTPPGARRFAPRHHKGEQGS